MQFDRKARLGFIIFITILFFILEIAVGVKTRSLAMVGDAFHNLGDIISYSFALWAQIVSERPEPAEWLTFGWQRAPVLCDFFNAVLLLALGFSIFMQSLERFAYIQAIESPSYITIVGCIGVGLNTLNLAFAHGQIHQHPPSSKEGTMGPEDGQYSAAHVNLENDSAAGKHSHGMEGVFLHVLGDLASNVGIVVVGVAVWFSHSPHRYYADPAVGASIALLIQASSICLARKTARILLDSVPPDIDLGKVRGEVENIQDVVSVRELRIRRLSESKAVGMVHVVVGAESVRSLASLVRQVSESIKRHGVDSVSVHPELNIPETAQDDNESAVTSQTASVKLGCAHCSSNECVDYRCCGGDAGEA